MFVWSVNSIISENNDFDGFVFIFVESLYAMLPFFGRALHIKREDPPSMIPLDGRRPWAPKGRLGSPRGGPLVPFGRLGPGVAHEPPEGDPWRPLGALGLAARGFGVSLNGPLGLLRMRPSTNCPPPLRRSGGEGCGVPPRGGLAPPQGPPLGDPRRPLGAKGLRPSPCPQGPAPPGPRTPRKVCF